MRFNPFKVYRINSVFFFSFAVIIALLIGLMTYISYRESTVEITTKVSYYQQRLLNELNKKINTNLVYIERTAVTAAKNTETLFDSVNEGDLYDQKRVHDEIRSQLSNFVFSTPILQSIDLYSDYPYRVQAHESVKFHTMEQLKEQPWYERIENVDSAWIGEHHIDSNQGPIPVISFALKAYSRSGKYYALIVMNVKVSSFHSMLATENIQSSLVLLDGTDNPIIIVGEDDPDKLEAFTKGTLAKSKEGVSRQGDDFIVWSTSADSNWTLIETTSWRELTEGSIYLTKLLILAGIALLLAGLTVVLFVSRQFTKPISILLRAMNQYSLKGHSNIPEDYRNEFGGLFQGFQKLVTRIEELYVSLEENHKRKTAAEIRSLQTMINPHFLYNTLDQINWVAIEREQHEISSMLSHLAQMFRMTLKNTSSFVTVADELAHIEAYLEFQVIRWENRLIYTIDVEMNCRELYMPKFVLQPFIENAFVHGFHGKSSAELNVKVTRNDEQLIIFIADNGNGLKSKEAHPFGGQAGQAGQARQGGHGMSNVSERIEALFGEQYGFSLDPNPVGAGVLVTIILPITMKEDISDDRSN